MRQKDTTKEPALHMVRPKQRMIGATFAAAEEAEGASVKDHLKVRFASSGYQKDMENNPQKRKTGWVKERYDGKEVRRTTEPPVEDAPQINNAAQIENTAQMEMPPYLISSVPAVSVPRTDRAEIIRRCQIREASRFTGVKTREQKMAKIISQEERMLESGPSVCSVDERIRFEQEWQANEEKRGSDRQERFSYESREQEMEEDCESSSGESKTFEWNIRDKSSTKQSKSSAGGKNGKSGRGGETDSDVTGKDDRKKKKDKTSRVMLRNYIVKELIHEEGKNDPYSHIKLLQSLVKHQLLRPVKFTGKMTGIFFVKGMAALLGFLIPIVTAMLPFAIILYFIFSPVSYFMGIFNSDKDLSDNPQYIKNVVQEMYISFYGKISMFEDKDANNQTEYIYGGYSNSEQIIAVYLAQICSSPEYKEMSGNSKYPPYVFVDTTREAEYLTRIFEQFNYTETEKITVNGTNTDGTTWEAEAEKMSIYCLSIDKWKELHLSELTKDAKELLEVLLNQEAETSGGNTGGTNTGNSVPITDLVIPEGVDEKLVYMAGFIKAEAGNQPYQGKIAVAYVILNRAGGAAGDVKGVLTAPYQFSCYIPYHTVERYLQQYASMTDAQRVQDECWKAAVGAYNGTETNPIGTMKYYCNPKACSVGEAAQWERIRERNSEAEIIVIGDHVFCQNCW